jgi:hypothetical protein
MARFAGIWACSSARLVRFSPIAGRGVGAHAQLTATCRIVHAAHVRQPCGSRTADRTTGDQEGHRVAAAPPGCEWTVSVALHSQPCLLGLRLGCRPRAQPPVARPGFAVGCVRAAVTPAASLVFLGGRWSGAPARAPAMGPSAPRPDGQPSQPPNHETRNLNLPVAPGARDERNALVRWAVLLEGVIR